MRIQEWRLSTTFLFGAFLLAAPTFLMMPAQSASGASKPATPIYADDCSSQQIDPKVWKLQCSSDQFALFCDKKGEEKKCACVRGNKYLNTYGAHCSDLPCFHKVCQ